MRITQAFVGAKNFKVSFLAKYGLKEYRHMDRPAIFFGCYTKQWYHLQVHQSLAVVIWAGTDAYNLRFNPKFCKFLQEHVGRIFHVSISKYIEDDLKMAGLPFRTLPITPHTYHGIKPSASGQCVYVYMPEVRQEFYGMPIIKELRAKMPDIVFKHASINTYSRLELMRRVYPSCFIGLRLTQHDGLSNTVVEMALSGKRSISNAGYPCTIPWTDVDSIIQAIRQEKANPPDPEHIAKTMRKWLNIPDNWLEQEYWEQKGKLEKKIKVVLDHEMVSVIMNTYKEDPDILLKAIQSYENQQGVKIQIIISTVEGDPSVQVGKDRGHTVVISEKPGIYEQLNHACSAIRGDWVCYASGNDYADPHKCVNEIRTCYETNKLVCYSSLQVVSHEGLPGGIRKFQNYNYFDHLKGNYVSDCAMINTELLKKFLPFDNVKYGNHAFWDLWLRIYEKHGNLFVYYGKPTWFYRHSPTSAHILRKSDEGKGKVNIDLRRKLQMDHAELSKQIPLRFRV